MKGNKRVDDTESASEPPSQTSPNRASASTSASEATPVQRPFQPQVVRPHPQQQHQHILLQPQQQQQQNHVFNHPWLAPSSIAHFSGHYQQGFNFGQNQNQHQLFGGTIGSGSQSAGASTSNSSSNSFAEAFSSPLLPSTSSATASGSNRQQQSLSFQQWLQLPSTIRAGIGLGGQHPINTLMGQAGSFHLFLGVTAISNGGFGILEWEVSVPRDRWHRATTFGHYFFIKL